MRNYPVVHDQQRPTEHPMQDALEIIKRVAPSDLTVIITGEQGTGKEWAARLIHGMSSRASRPFHAVDCSAFPTEQVEKEIFGFESLSWDGIDIKRSAFEEAAGGTLFLHDLESTPNAVQLKVARAIEYGQYRRIGGEALHRLETRLIVGIHLPAVGGKARELPHEAFASRSTAITIALPPLRDRKAEIPALIQTLLATLGVRYAHGHHSISQEAVELCRLYPWPGNVRQLKNALEYASVMCPGGGEIRPDHLPEFLRSGRHRG